MVLADHPISQPSLDISPIWIPIITAELFQTTTPASVNYSGNCVFSAGAMQRKSVFLVMTSVLTVLCF
jgi:hypothetical protein